MDFDVKKVIKGVTCIKCQTVVFSIDGFVDHMKHNPKCTHYSNSEELFVIKAHLLVEGKEE